MTSDAGDILKKLPSKTPLWAVGLVTVIVSTAVSLAMLYTFARSEVKDYMSNSFTLRDKQVTADSSACAAVLGLVQSNAKQITFLLEENSRLTTRVQVLEQERNEDLSNLEACQKKCHLGDK